jgi:Lon protease-like protein
MLTIAMDTVCFFDLNIGNLPNDLPVFILPDVVLLPEGKLSIRITDIKQIALVLWTLAHGRMFALMAQTPKESAVGCAVRICGFSENEDNSLNVSFLGICRFKTKKCFNTDNHDMLNIDYTPFLGDFESNLFNHEEALLSALNAYLIQRHIDIDVSLFSKMTSRRLLATLISVLPLDFIEKRAVMECIQIQDQIQTLITILKLSVNSDDLNKGVQKC